MKGFIKLVAAFLVLFTSAAVSQQAFDARSTGMAFSNAAAAMGLEQVGLNPATLALRQNFNFELNLLSLNVAASNNSLNKAQYDKYFTTGDTLSNADLSDILNSIPLSGWKVDLNGRATLLGLYTRNLSLSVTGIGNGYVTLPREIYELATQGNRRLGEVYSFDNLEGQGWGGLSGNLGIAIPLRRKPGADLNLVSLGFTGKYIFGLVYYDVLSSHGNFYNLIDHLRAEGTMEINTAQKGHGVALDLGMLFQFKERLTLSIAALNVIGSVKWDVGPRRERLSFAIDSLVFNLDGLSFPELVEDSNYVKSRESFDIAPFTTRLPVVLDMGFAYQVWKRLLITGEYEQGFHNKMLGANDPRVALGTELTILPFLPLRAGISFGGYTGKALAFGAGLNLKYWFLDVGILTHDSYSLNQSRGITLAATSRFRF